MMASPSFRETNSAASLSSSSLSSCWSSSIASSCSTSQTSSANPSPTSHDVFISFRGEDTRNGFVSHLRAAFTRHGIKTYMDCDLERGNEISSTLLVAIKQSKILLLVFSENYVESRWTMDELAKIMECKRTRGQHVIPIFYKVRPTNVRHQKGNYEIAFKRHKKLFKVNDSTLQQWRTAMTEAANLSRWEISGSRSEAELVEEIANDVLRKLESMSRSPVIVGDIQIATEPQGANFASQNHSNDLNSGASHDLTPQESFCNKCLSNRAIFRSRRFKSSRTEEDPTILFLHNQRSTSLLPPVFTYEELEAATNRFDPKRKIGDGGLYLGQLHESRVVAVKYLDNHHTEAAAGPAFSTMSFSSEILILSSIDHPNLVKLHGYCSDPRGLLLVYDHVPKGTLAEHLQGPKSSFRKWSLTWQVRLDIALQTALAMEYLHCFVVPPIVHRDITSSNIFVERDMRIKVGDFGLSRLLVLQDTSSSSTGYVWMGPQGTPGYLDPDYHRSFRLTEKSDVYSFGVVLLELISGLKAVDQGRDKQDINLVNMVLSRIHVDQLNQLVDPVLAMEDVMDAVAAVAELALRCVAFDKDDRPDSKEVVAELKRVRAQSLRVSDRHRIPTPMLTWRRTMK